MKPLKPLYKALYYVVFCIAQTVVRLMYPVRALGKENIKGRGGYVLAPNHIAAIDPLFVLMARGAQPKMLIMGKEELFGHGPLLNFFWALAGAFPVDRGRGDRTVLNQAIDEVKKGRGLLIFPEGTRSKTGQLGRLKSGAFVVAMEAGTDIVPCVMWYKAGRPKAFHRCTVVFGKPITMQQLGLSGEYSAAKLREAKKVYAKALEDVKQEYAARL